jgi:hypothetical protein
VAATACPRCCRLPYPCRWARAQPTTGFPIRGRCTSGCQAETSLASPMSTRMMWPYDWGSSSRHSSASIPPTARPRPAPSRSALATTAMFAPPSATVDAAVGDWSHHGGRRRCGRWHTSLLPSFSATPNEPWHCGIMVGMSPASDMPHNAARPCTRVAGADTALIDGERRPAYRVKSPALLGFLAAYPPRARCQAGLTGVSL